MHARIKDLGGINARARLQHARELRHCSDRVLQMLKYPRRACAIKAGAGERQRTRRAQHERDLPARDFCRELDFRAIELLDGIIDSRKGRTRKERRKDLQLRADAAADLKHARAAREIDAREHEAARYARLLQQPLLLNSRECVEVRCISA